MHESWIKKLLSVLLSIFGWLFSLLACQWVLKISVLAISDYKRLGDLAIYLVPSLLSLIVGSLMLWGAIKLWSGWRHGIGGAALLCGLSLGLEALKKIANPDGPAQPYFSPITQLPVCLLSVVLGIGLLVWDRRLFPEPPVQRSGLILALKALSISVAAMFFARLLGYKYPQFPKVLVEILWMSGQIFGCIYLILTLRKWKRCQYNLSNRFAPYIVLALVVLLVTLGIQNLISAISESVAG